MTDLSINQHTVNDGVLRLAVTGEVDPATCDLLAATIRDATTGRVAEVVVDLDRVSFLDSSGIAALVAGHHLAAEHAVTGHVTNPHDPVRPVLDITGVLTALTERP